MSDVIVYRRGDKTKTPLKVSEQPSGTELVMVTPRGRDIVFVTGEGKTNTPEKLIQTFAKYRGKEES